MSLQHLHDRLDQVFRVLSGGSRTALPRQQSLKTMIDWSYQLLNPFERVLLLRLSVFLGGFELEAAEAVCGFGDLKDFQIADLLGSLVDKSLVQTDLTGTAIRYRLLETIRQYAAEAFATSSPSEVDVARTAHAKVFVELAEVAEPQLIGRDQGQWQARLDVERANLRNAVVYLASPLGDTAEALRLGLLLLPFWRKHGYYSEGAELLQKALELADLGQPSALRGAVLEAVGTLLFQRGDTAAALVSFEEGLAIARPVEDAPIVARLLGGICFVRFKQGRYDEAEAIADEVVRLANDGSDDTLKALALAWRATVKTGEPAQAAADLTTALKYFRRNGDLGHCVQALNNLGAFELRAGNLQISRANLEEARVISQEIHDDDTLISVLQNLGVVAILEHDGESAVRYASESLTLARRTSQQGWLPYIVLVFALSASAESDFERSATLHGAADSLIGNLDEAFEPLEADLRAKDHARVRHAMEDAAFNLAYERGLAMEHKEIVALALRQIARAHNRGNQMPHSA
jgi:non-specific serine/threonine protein kinase